MNKQKQVYLSPETETLVIRFEGVICGSNFGETGEPGAIPDFNDFGSF